MKPAMRFGLHIFLILSLLIASPFAFADVDIVDAGAGVEFVDLGLNPSTGEVTLVGTDDDVAKVFYLSGDRTSFSSATLVGLGPDTQVAGISSDGVRIAGVSKSDGSVDVGEGTTWLSSDPTSPTGIGFVDGFLRTSAAGGAWSAGVVGDHGGAADAIIWTATTGLVTLPDGGGQSTTFDVSTNGLVQVGFIQAKPVYWDSNGSNPFENPDDNAGRALTISPNAIHAGGGIDFLDFDPVFDAGTQAVVWTRVNGNYEITQLTNPNGSRFKGEVYDISNSGYAVGETSDGKGFIWHPSFDGVQTAFNGPQIFDDWIGNIDGGASLPAESSGVTAIAEDLANGQLVFSVNVNLDGEDTGALYVQADVPSLVPQYALWNGFLGMTNILELINNTETAQDVVVTIFDINGNGASPIPVTVPAGGQIDLVLNGREGFTADSFGVVTIQGSIIGRLFYYRNGLSALDFEFAFGIPFGRPTYGISSVGFNTFQPSLDPVQANNPVLNWLSVVNLSTSAEAFVVKKYDMQGSLLSESGFSLQPFQRADLDGGHDNPGPNNVGLLKIIPQNNSAPYLAQLIRYGVNGAGFDFAFPLVAKKGSGDKIYVPLTTKDKATNYLEVVNTSDVSTTAVLKFYNRSGFLVRMQEIGFGPNAQGHLLINGDVLADEELGHVEIDADKPHTIVSQSMSYLRNDKQQIISMFGLQGELRRSEKISTSYNLFLGMSNDLRVSNLSSGILNYTLKIRQVGNPNFTTLNLSLQPFATEELFLAQTQTYGTASDTYGTVILESPAAGQLQAHVVRKHSGFFDTALDFVAPTVAK
jgi:hypothetical protein